MIRKRIEFLTMMLLLVSVCIQAEILVLRNGSRIEGKILATGRVNTVVMIEDRYVVIETRNIEKILSEKKEIKKQEPKKEIKGIKKGNNKGGAKDKISIEKVVVQPTVAKDVAGTITAKLRVFRSTPWSWSKRQQTIKELAVMARRDQKVLRYLSHLSSQRKFHDISGWIARTLEAVATPQAYREIYACVAKHRENAATEAISALRHYRNRKTFELLVNLLQSRRRDVKMAAISSLSEFEHPGTFAPLVDRIQDSDRKVALRAKMGVQKLLKNDQLKAYCGKVIVRRLENHRKLTHFFRYHLIHLLGEINCPAATDILYEILYSHPKCYQVTVHTLARIGTSRAREILVGQWSTASDDSHKKTLLKAYGRLKISPEHNDFIEILIEQLSYNESKQLRKIALQSLVRSTGKDFRLNAICWQAWWQDYQNSL